MSNPTVNDEISTPNGIVVEVPSKTEPSVIQKVIGRLRPSSSSVEEFRGIPYGHVSKRWEHSVMIDRLPDDVFDAMKNGPKCPQPAAPNDTFIYQSYLEFPDTGEDEFKCLNLFISRPSSKALSDIGWSYEKTSLPVYFYIHGGAYAFGAGTDPMWDPAHLMIESIRLKKPIIAVMINYRLNAFGFAGSRDILDGQASSSRKGLNFGIGDQRVALEWTSHNIAAFGGDPDRITIGGQSAGSSSVHAHVLEAKFGGRRPLFRRAIMQSGAVGTLGPLSMDGANARWDAMCHHVEQTNGHSAESRLKMMQSLSSSELLDTGKGPESWIFPLINDDITIRTRENGRWTVHVGDDHSDIPPSKSTMTEPLTVLVGDNAVEGVVFTMLVKDIESFGSLLDRIGGPNAMLDHEGISEILAQYQIDNSTTPKELFDRLIEFLGEVDFGFPIKNAWAELSTISSLLNSQAAEETIKPYHSRSKLYRVNFGNPFPGLFHDVSTHCVELLYVFDAFHDDLRKQDGQHGAESTGKYSDQASNASLVETIQSHWISFIADDIMGDEELDERKAIVFDTDRRGRIVDMETDADFIKRNGRHEVLTKYHDTVTWLATRLRGSAS